MMHVQHYGDITSERVVILYTILSGKSIDVDRVLFDSIIHTIWNMLGFYFNLLIT